MQRLDIVDFVREVLAELDDLPPDFERRLVALTSSAPTTRWSRIRELIEEVTRG